MIVAMKDRVFKLEKKEAFSFWLKITGFLATIHYPLVEELLRGVAKPHSITSTLWKPLLSLGSRAATLLRNRIDLGFTILCFTTWMGGGKGNCLPLCISFENSNFPVGLPPSKKSPEIIFFLCAPLPQFLSLFSSSWIWNQFNIGTKIIFFFLLFWEIKSHSWFDESFCFTGKSIPPPTWLHFITDTRKIPIPSKLDRSYHKVRRNYCFFQYSIF